MFIIIPLVLIGLSLLGMVIIVRGKMTYLRKLSPESHQVSDNIFEDFFPEIVEWFNGIPWHHYYQVSLQELEKGLRRMRLVFLKIDNVAMKLIQKVRHTHITTQLEHEASVQLENTEVAIQGEKELVVEPTAEDLKGQEQQLIIEIAQDPKNAALYENLGDLYLKMGNEQDAKEAFEAGLSFGPDNQVLARKYSVILKNIASKEVVN
ncbi:MAG: hypothetical protein KBC81_03765 [Candidatus Pacebacteria bacterium]|nr:hypothetical protein [Candidatus Paceibacterota bacterium]